MRPHVGIDRESQTDTIRISASSQGQYAAFVVTEEVYKELEAKVVERWQALNCCPECGISRTVEFQRVNVKCSASFCEGHR